MSFLDGFYYGMRSLLVCASDLHTQSDEDHDIANCEPLRPPTPESIPLRPPTPEFIPLRPPTPESIPLRPPTPIFSSCSSSSSYVQRGDRANYLEDPIYHSLKREYGQKIATAVYLNNVVMPHSVLAWSEETGRWQLIPPPSPDFDVGAELRFRASFLYLHEVLWSTLTRKCPGLRFSEIRRREFQQHLSGIYRCPEIFTEGGGRKEWARLKNVEIFLSELISSNLSEADTDFLLGVAMKQFAPGISFHLISEFSTLMDTQRVAKFFVRHNELKKDANYARKDSDKVRYLLHNGEFKVPTKFKPLEVISARNEQVGFLCDQALGTGMSCPTKWVSLSMKNEMKEIALFFRTHRKKEAYERFFALPASVKHMVYNSTFKQVSPPHTEIMDNFGRSYFLKAKERDPEFCSKVILNTLKQRAFKQWKIHSPLDLGASQGVLQYWFSGATNVLHLLEFNSHGAELLKAIPPALCHWYALLGLIKGAQDGQLSNTLFHGRREPVVDGGSSSSSSTTATFVAPVSCLMDCDDEVILVSENRYENFRMWQFGLPQNGLPFSRAELVMIVSSDLLAKFTALHERWKGSVPERALRAQLDRIQQIVSICEEELRKSVPALTPRDLFFSVLGGRERFESARTRGIEPVLIFEYMMSRETKEGDSDWMLKNKILMDNIRSLSD